MVHAATPNPVFKFSNEVHAVKVEHVTRSAKRDDILQLFNALIGDVCKCTEYFDEKKSRVFEISFSSADAYKKALCMSGYTISGVPLMVSAATHQETRRPIQKPFRANDSRRNLYVLGLPFDLNKNEFVEVFSHYGTVSHAVILATVDNASRRRGFVVMSTHQEARYAMESLSRKEIKGHIIDVSWAVVQRSQGFLDGGDRNVILSQTNLPSPSSSLDHDSVDMAASPESPAILTPPMDGKLQPLVSSLVPVLLVTNLPNVLFSTPADFYPLLCPFGDIVKLKVLSPTSDGCVSVTVEYKTISQAREALESLNGQCYTHKVVKAEFLFSEQPSSVDTAFGGWSTGCDNRPGLNPYAAPFTVPKPLSSDANAWFQSSDTLCEQDNRESSGFWSGQSTPRFPLRGGSPVYPPTGLLAPPTTTLRPHSAPSDSPKNTYIRRPGHWSCYPQNLPGLSFSFSPFSD